MNEFDKYLRDDLSYSEAIGKDLFYVNIYMNASCNVTQEICINFKSNILLLHLSRFAFLL